MSVTGQQFDFPCTSVRFRALAVAALLLVCAVPAWSQATSRPERKFAASANGTLDIANPATNPATSIEQPIPTNPTNPTNPATPATPDTPATHTNHGGSAAPVQGEAFAGTSNEADVSVDDADAPVNDSASSRESRLVGSGGGTTLSEDTRPVGGDSGSVGESGAMQMVKTFLALILVLALIYGLSRLMKRWSTGGRSGSAGLVEVLSRTPVTHRHGLLLVRVGAKVLVVGLSPENLSPLAEIDDPQEVANIIGAVQSKRPDSLTNTFASALNSKQMEVELEQEALEKMDLDSARGSEGSVTSSTVDRLEAMLRKVRGMGTSHRKTQSDGHSDMEGGL